MILKVYVYDKVEDVFLQPCPVLRSIGTEYTREVTIEQSKTVKGHIFFDRFEPNDKWGLQVTRVWQLSPYYYKKMLKLIKNNNSIEFNKLANKIEDLNDI